MTLQIFPKHPEADAYYVNGSYTPWAIVGRDKRFSDAELASETWASMIDVALGGEAENLIAKHGTIHRFAQLPHFDD